MSSKKTKIVIIDDEVDLCFLLSNMLISQGFEVKYYHNLKTGLIGATEIQPDWIIIDNNLPDGLGWEKVTTLIDLVPNASIIKISANPDSFRDKPRDFIHYLIKPINVNSIVELVKNN